MSASPTRFKAFLRERNEFSKDGSETLLSVSEYYGVKPRAEAFDEDRQESRADSLVGYRLVKKGDLVMNYMLAWKGAYGVSEFDGIVSPAYSVFEVDDGRIERRFLHHRTRSRDMQAVFKRNSRGIMESRLRLYPENLLSIGFDLPPRNIQASISTFLDRETSQIDGLIEKKTRFIALLKEKRAAVITHAVTKGINPDAPMKDSGVDWLGHVPAHWTVSRLRFHVLVNPSQKEQRKLAPERPTSFFPMDAIGEKGELDHSHIRRLDEVQSGYSYFAEGDVVVAKVTPCFENGKGAIMSGLLGDFGFGTTEITTLRPDQGLDKAFLYLLTSTWPFRKIGVSHMTGAGGLKRVPDDFFRNFTFGMPPMAEQQDIVRDVENQTARIDGLITLTERSIDLLREKRAALITAAVTGKIDVRAAA
jgi:type I restriction enzyme, S subunit